MWISCGQPVKNCGKVVDNHALSDTIPHLYRDRRYSSEFSYHLLLRRINTMRKIPPSLNLQPGEETRLWQDISDAPERISRYRKLSV